MTQPDRSFRSFRASKSANVVPERRTTDSEAPKFTTKCFTFLWPEKFVNQSLRESNNVDPSFIESN